MGLFSYEKETTLLIDGVEYKIPTDFRFCLNLLLSILNEDEKKVINILNRYNLPLNKFETCLIELSTFLSCGGLPPLDESKNDNSFFKVFDFEQDENLIFASFLTDYKIDLNTATLHWWQFMGLLTNLSEETPLMKAIHYRTVDISKVPKEQRELYKQMKQRYKLARKEKQEPKKQMTAEERHKEWIQKAEQAFKKAEKQIKNRKGDKNGRRQGYARPSDIKTRT